MNESEIRPKKIFEEYLGLAKKDAKDYFFDSEKEEVGCPACNQKGVYAFTKDYFEYCDCLNCWTLFVNPRPVASSFNEYYKDSPSSVFWATTFYKKTESARREKIWKPKAKLINQKLKQFSSHSFQIVDVGGGYGIFAEEMQQYSSKPILIIEPAEHLAKVCEEKGFHVTKKFLEDVSIDDLNSNRKCFVSFELFEHLHSPELFLKNLFSIMNSGDLFIFTTLSGLGLDIQILREKSPSVSPPHHLNFLNPKSVQILLENVGFVCEEVSTPGKLDIDILNNNIDQIESSFWKNFLLTSSNDEKEKWQTLISDSGRSSHMMIVCRKA